MNNFVYIYVIFYLGKNGKSENEMGVVPIIYDEWLFSHSVTGCAEMIFEWYLVNA